MRGDEQENRALKDITMTIRNAALTSGTPVIVLAHLGKPDRRNRQLVPRLEAFHGSSDLIKIATRVITIGPATEKTKQLNRKGISYTYVAVRKDRHRGAQGYVELVGFNRQSLSYDERYNLGRMSWAGDEFSELAANDLPHWAHSAFGARDSHEAR